MQLWAYIFFPADQGQQQQTDIMMCADADAGWYQALSSKLGKTLHIFCVNPTTPHALLYSSQ